MKQLLYWIDKRNELVLNSLLNRTDNIHRTAEQELPAFSRTSTSYIQLDSLFKGCDPVLDKKQQMTSLSLSDQ